MERSLVPAAVVVVVGLLFAASADSVGAQTFPGLRLRGTLTDQSGKPMEGLTTVTARIYTVPSGGTPVYTEQFTALLVAGAVDLILGIGSGTPTGDLLGALLPDDSGSVERYLALSIEQDTEELPPRRRLTGEAYAAVAIDAELLGGQPASAYATSAEAAALLAELATLKKQLTRICTRIPPLCRP